MAVIYLCYKIINSTIFCLNDGQRRDGNMCRKLRLAIIIISPGVMWSRDFKKYHFWVCFCQKIFFSEYFKKIPPKVNFTSCGPIRANLLRPTGFFKTVYTFSEIFWSALDFIFFLFFSLSYIFPQHFTLLLSQKMRLW